MGIEKHNAKSQPTLNLTAAFGIMFYEGVLMEIRTVSELLMLLESDEHDFYRGHADFRWNLQPSISRIQNPRSCYSIKFSGWLNLENYLICEFKKYSSIYLNEKPINKYEWLVQAQHHGLPTRLLDWSNNPLKALFFAVEDRNFDQCDAALYMCTPKTLAPDTESIHNAEGVQFFYSDYINDRISAQEGAFSMPQLRLENDGFFDLPEITPSSVLKFNKVKIPSTSKHQLRYQLNRLGINHRTIYPSLEGISKMLREGFA